MALSLLLLLALPAAAGAAAPAGEGPLNVVVLDICTARADHTGFGGYRRPTTPGLDRFAKESVVFSNAWAQSTWCLPNYASLFTGHVPEVHGQYANLPFRELPEFETTLAEKMSSAGYRTGGFTGGIYFLPAWGLSRGFDVFENRFSTAHALPAPFSATAPRLLSWIEEGGRRPFFAYATVDDLHAPYQSDDPELFDPGYDGVVHSTGVLNVRFFRAYNGEPLEPGDPLHETLRRFRSEGPRALRHLIAHYDAALRQADRSVSAFLDALRAKGLWDRTVVVVTGDHGEMLGEKGLLGHTEGVYEGNLRVPLVVHHPRHRGGRRVDVPVQRLDLTPTLLELAGASDEGLELQGRSLLPLVAGTEPAGARRYAFASSKRNMARPTDLLIDERAVRDERFKLIWRRHAGRFELFDLLEDPRELRDLAAKRPDVVARLAFELLARAEETRPKTPGRPSGREDAAPAGLDRPEERD